MNYFTVRNTVILGLVQIIVIVVGVLGACVAHKWFVPWNVKLPQWTIFVADYGIFALILPVIWVAWALLVLRREDESGYHVLAVVAGILLLVGLLVVTFNAAVVPFVGIIGGWSLG
jgi:hypothetical protein